MINFSKQVENFNIQAHDLHLGEWKYEGFKLLDSPKEKSLRKLRKNPKENQKYICKI